MQREPMVRERIPSYTVMRECLRRQSATGARGTAARVFGQSPLNPEVRGWYRGALGEVEVVGEFGRLGDEWTVLHAVPLSSSTSEVDHMAIGPGGVYAITTRNLSGQRVLVMGGTVRVDGRPTDFIRIARDEAERAATSLGRALGEVVEVRPVIVIIDPASTSRRPSSVAVLESGEVCAWLLNQPIVHSDGAVARIAKAAETPATWRDCPLVDDQAESPEASFAVLRSEVDAARSRARGWIVLALTAVLGALGGGALALSNLFPVA